MNTHQNPDFETLLAQQAQTNPKLKLMFDMMKNQNQAKPETKTKTQGQFKKLLFINSKLTKKVKALRLQQKNILKYLNFFIDVNTVFSSAVGACECWGEDNNCEHCHGNGNPGYFQVDESAFQQYVMPCMEQVKEEQQISEKDQEPILNQISNN